MRTETPNHRPAATFLCAVLLTVAPLRDTHAQSHVDGLWFVRYELLVRSMHDADAHVVHETAKMTLRARGDSVFGTWEPSTDPTDATLTPSSVRGTVRGDSVRVEIDTPPPFSDGFFTGVGREIVEFLKTYVHGMPPMTPHIDAVARGDSLLGTRGAVSADGSKRILPRLLIATRRPGS